jgi:hypothetical protein
LNRCRISGRPIKSWYNRMRRLVKAALVHRWPSL